MATAAIIIVTLCLIGGCVLVIGTNNDVNVEGIDIHTEVEADEVEIEEIEK